MAPVLAKELMGTTLNLYVYVWKSFPKINWTSPFLPLLIFFFPLQTYFGMDVSAVEDPVQRRALETMIKTYGQTPRQLFHTAHVSRPGSRLIMEGELPAAMGLLVQFAFRETREHTKEIIYPVRHFDCEMVWLTFIYCNHCTSNIYSWIMGHFQSFRERYWHCVHFYTLT